MNSLRNKSLTAIVFACLTSFTMSANAVTFHVDGENGSDNNGGTLGWNDAFKTLQKAISIAQQDDQIWVKGSDDGGITYFPDEGPNVTPGDQTASFEMESGVQIRGGYSGNTQDPMERDPAIYETILSGDLQDNDVSVTVTLPPGEGFLDFGDDIDENGIPDSYEDNSYHVVTATDVDSSAVLDGFTIRGGNAVGDTNNEDGGGLVIHRGANNGVASEATIVNCVFKENLANRGAAVFGNAWDNDITPVSKPQFRNCVFRHNEAFTSGGAISMSNNSPDVLLCVFEENEGDNSGGAAKVTSGELQFVNCVFRRNFATIAGALITFVCDVDLVNCLFHDNYTMQSQSPFAAAICFENTTSHLTNCTLADNFEGYALVMDPAAVVIVRNSIFWGNFQEIFLGGGDIDIDFTDLEGGVDAIKNHVDATVTYGPNNLDIDPMFDGSPGFEYRQVAESPIIDMGNIDENNVGNFPSDTFDLDDDGDTSEPTPDLDSVERLQDGVDDGNVVIDLGAFEHPDNCTGDITGDFNVGVEDLLDLLEAWGKCPTPCPPSCDADIVENCVVDVSDLLALLSTWGDCGIAPEEREDPPAYVDDCLERYGDDPVALEACLEAQVRKSE